MSELFSRHLLKHREDSVTASRDLESAKGWKHNLKKLLDSLLYTVCCSLWLGILHCGFLGDLLCVRFPSCLILHSHFQHFGGAQVGADGLGHHSRCAAAALNVTGVYDLVLGVT